MECHAIYPHYLCDLPVNHEQRIGHLVVECPLVDKLCNTNTHNMVEGSNIHLSAIINADTCSLENA